MMPSPKNKSAMGSKRQLQPLNVNGRVVTLPPT